MQKKHVMRCCSAEPALVGYKKEGGRETAFFHLQGPPPFTNHR